jgi:Xaa-Pro aminopeptidase
MRGLQSAMAQAGLDLVVIPPGPNMYYLSGVFEDSQERPLLLLIPQAGDPFFFSPSLYTEQIRSESWVDDIKVWYDHESPASKLGEIISGYKKIGLEGSIPVGWFFGVINDCSAVTDANSLTKSLRQIKDDSELQALERACDIAARALEENMVYLTPGVTERKFAKRIEDTMVELGAQERAFSTIVAFGQNAALPHHRASDAVLKSDTPVVIDFGCRYAWYNSDMTRTVYVGKPDQEFLRAYKRVMDAQEEALSLVAPGTEANRLDLAARKSLDKGGLGNAFIHRLGHGIGLEVHEDPYITSSNAEPLREGMCFSVEPGVYFPEKFGIRIEDIVCVTGKGYKMLTRFARDLMLI